jgi:hypothetical protein
MRDRADALSICREQIFGIFEMGCCEVDNNKEEMELKYSKANHIIALALMEHLYHQGKISEFVYQNIKKDVMSKFPVDMED